MRTCDAGNRDRNWDTKTDMVTDADNHSEKQTDKNTHTKCKRYAQTDTFARASTCTQSKNINNQ